MNTTLSMTVAALSISTCVDFSSAGSISVLDQDYSAIVERQLSPALDAKLFPGAVIGIYKDGETSFYPVGTLNFEQDEAPDVDTLYEIGSISKVFTGVLFADSVRRGEASRDTLVNDLLPDGYRVEAKDGEDLQLWHLTTHTSGWPTAPANLAPTDGENPFFGYTQDMMFEAIDLMPLQHQPGTNFEYSNYAVGLLGTLIAQHAGIEYEQLVTERILEPLGISSFAIELSDKQSERLAPATTAGRATKSWGKTGPMDPAGMWITSAPELLRFAISNLKHDDQDTEIQDTIQETLEMSREKLFDLESGGAVCFGWFLAGDKSTYWHNGLTGGYSSYMAVNPQHDAAVVMLANGAVLETTMIGEKVLQAVLGLNPDPVEIHTDDLLAEEYTDLIVGTYNSSLGFDMFVTATYGRLFAQITGQQPLELTRVSKNRFRFKLVDAEIEFTLDKDAEHASKVTLYQNGMEIECERKD